MKKPVKILLLVLLFLFAIGATFFITYHAVSYTHLTLPTKLEV